jgi:hypothetical protein
MKKLIMLLTLLILSVSCVKGSVCPPWPGMSPEVRVILQDNYTPEMKVWLNDLVKLQDKLDECRE